jgi:arylsulfatase
MKGVDNLVLLSVDALRADHVSCYGYHRETTPLLNELASENLQFDSAYSVSSHTREAIPGLLTGRYPDEAVSGDYNLAAEPLSAMAREAGRATAAFHSNPFVSRAFGYDHGFDTFDDDLHLGQHKLVAFAQRALDKLRNRHYARASEINDRSLAWLDSLDDEPFFLWNHYMDPHGPYLPVGDFREMYADDPPGDRTLQRLYKRAIREPESITDAERRLLIDCYDAEIAYTDAKLREFLDGLAERGLLRNTAVVVTADHGDAFGEHGYYEHPRYLHDELTHVPMLVRLPDSSTARIETPVSTLDVVPTALDLFGIDHDVPGRSLLDLASDAASDRTVFSQAAGEDEDANLRRFAARDRESQAFGTYDVEAESASITQQSDARIGDQLKTHIAERRGHLHGSTGRDEEDVDGEVERRLSALGYKE